MKSSTKKKVAGGAAATIAAAALVVVGLNGGNAVEIPYTLDQDAFVYTLEVMPPDEASIDIVELYLNDELVDKTLLPDGKLHSIPVAFSDLTRLELKLYNRGEQIGSASFKDGKLYYKGALSR